MTLRVVLRSRSRPGLIDAHDNRQAVKKQALGLRQVRNLLGVAAEAAPQPGLAETTGDHRSFGGCGTAGRQGAGSPGRRTTVRPLSPPAPAHGSWLGSRSGTPRRTTATRSSLHDAGAAHTPLSSTPGSEQCAGDDQDHRYDGASDESGLQAGHQVARSAAIRGRCKISDSCACSRRRARRPSVVSIDTLLR